MIPYDPNWLWRTTQRVDYSSASSVGRTVGALQVLCHDRRRVPGYHGAPRNNERYHGGTGATERLPPHHRPGAPTLGRGGAGPGPARRGGGPGGGTRAGGSQPAPGGQRGTPAPEPGSA